MMNDFLVVSSSISIIGSILKMLSYIAIISVSFKGVQALNIYINKNSR